MSAQRKLLAMNAEQHGNDIKDRFTSADDSNRLPKPPSRPINNKKRLLPLPSNPDPLQFYRPEDQSWSWKTEKKARVQSIFNNEPIRFLLLEAHYVPHDQHRIYVLGRTEAIPDGITKSTSTTHGICAVTNFQNYFYITKKVPFKNSSEAKDFLRKVQNHLDELDEVHISNPYRVYSDKEDVFASKLGWTQSYSGFGNDYQLQEQANAWKNERQQWGNNNNNNNNNGGGGKRKPAPKVRDNMRNFCTKFELIDGVHKTAAHYTPENVYEQVLKIEVRLPYMVNSLHLYFESVEYFRRVDLQQDLVKSFLGTRDIALSFVLNNNLARGKWCTLDNYTHLLPKERVVYRSLNVKFDLAHITCDHVTVKAGLLRVLSFDCEMPAKTDPETNMTRFCRHTVRKPDGSLDYDNTDTDACVVIVAMIFTVGADFGLSFTEARAFTYRHPDQEQRLPSNSEWDELLTERFAQALKAENARRSAVNSGENGDHAPDTNTRALPILDEANIKLKSPWNYDKLVVREYDTEMEMIYAFENHLHASDIDIICGWNEEGFDFPYLYWRYVYHAHVLNGAYNIPNFGALVGGFSTLRKQDGLYKKNDCDVVSTDMYTKNDGVVIWVKDQEAKPYSLNMVSSRELVYPLDHIQRGFIIQRDTYRHMFPSQSPISSTPSSSSSLEFNHDKWVSEMTPEELEYETFLALDDIEEKLVSGSEKFPMKKLEFDHATGYVSWKTGGYLWLRYIFYCMADTLLAYMNLRVKGKILNQQSLCMVAGVNLSDVIGRGQQSRVVNNIYVNCHKRYGGTYLVQDKGYNHLHWHGVFRHPMGPRAAVEAQWSRLMPYEGNHVFLTDDGGDLAVVAKSGSTRKKGQGASPLAKANQKSTKKKKQPPGNEGGFVQQLESEGIQEGYVTTLDFRSMYPYILYILNLCFVSSLNSFTIAEYNVKKYEYFSKTIGASNKNMCGERVTDPEASAVSMIHTPDVKKTHFHQGCPTILPPLIIDLAQERTNGKDSKMIWAIIMTAVKSTGSRGFLNSSMLESKKKWAEFRLTPATPSTSMTGTSTTIEDYVFDCAPWYWGKRDLEMSQFKRRLFHTLCEGILRSEDPYDFVNLCQSNTMNFDAYQLQVKVFMNSLYGVLMMCYGALSYPELSATITSFGRYLLNLIRTITETLSSDKAKTHKLFFGWNKKKFTKDIMEILVEIYKKEQHSATNNSNSDMNAEYLDIDEMNDTPAIKEAKAAIKIKHLVSFIKSKETMGLGFLRHIDNEMMRTLTENNVLKSFQALFSLYGDTDSIMVKLPQSSVVNRHQAFAVMEHLTETINDKLIQEMLLQPEKISEVMNLHKQKNYDMKAMLKPEKDVKLDWLFKGSDKSDTSPFVNDLLNMSRAYLLLRIGEGHAKNTVFQSLCLIIKRELLKLATGEISPAKLTITKKLSRFDPDGTLTHNRVAIQMKNRGETVNSGDLITYIHVLLKNGSNQILDKNTTNQVNKSGKRKKPIYRQAVESFDYVMKMNLKIDLEYIWTNCIKNKLTAFLRNVVAPIFDHVRLSSVYPSVMQNQEYKKNKQHEEQENLVYAVMYEGEGDIEWRFRKRNRALGANRWTSDVGKEYECAICYTFFVEKATTKESCHSNENVGDNDDDGDEDDNIPKKRKDVTKLCPGCMGKKHVRIAKLRKMYEKSKKTYFGCRALCTVCITLPESPCGQEKKDTGMNQVDDDNNETMVDIEDIGHHQKNITKLNYEIINNAAISKSRTLPEDCTFKRCETHVMRTEAHASLINYQKLIENLTRVL